MIRIETVGIVAGVIVLLDYTQVLDFVDTQVLWFYWII